MKTKFCIWHVKSSFITLQLYTVNEWKYVSRFLLGLIHWQKCRHFWIFTYFQISMVLNIVKNKSIVPMAHFLLGLLFFFQHYWGIIDKHNCKIFKVYNVMIQFMYTVWKDSPIKLINTSIASHIYLLWVFSFFWCEHLSSTFLQISTIQYSVINNSHHVVQYTFYLMVPSLTPGVMSELWGSQWLSLMRTLMRKDKPFIWVDPRFRKNLRSCEEIEVET